LDGLQAQAPGRRVADPRDCRIDQLQRENCRLHRRAEVAEQLIELKKSLPTGRESPAGKTLMSLIATAPTRLSKQHICRAPGQSRHRCYPDHRQRKLAAPACVPGLCPPLITEALRVAGALLHHASDSALMAGVSSLGDAGPRDIVPRRVTAGQAAGGRVWLDATAVEGDWAQRFPTVLRRAWRTASIPGWLRFR
jgi:hypothetical protein